MPTSVARTGSNLPNGNFLPEIWSKKLQIRFYINTVLDMITNHDWEGEVKDKGAKVIIRKRPKLIVRDYTVNGGIDYQDLDDDKLEMMLDKAKYWAFKCDDIDNYQSDIPLMNETIMDGAEEMKIFIDAHVLGSVYPYAGNALPSTVVAKTNVLDWLVDAGTKLDEANVPETGRFSVLPPWICGMIKKSDLQDASIAGDGTSILRNGRVGMIDRFTVYNSNNLATTSGTSNCIAGTKHGISFASQIAKVEHFDKLENQFAGAVRALNVYGFEVTQPDALLHMPATKT